MLDDTPSFEIYQDPPDPHELLSSSPAIDCVLSSPSSPQRPTRVVLAEIKLPSWGVEAHCNSALKHEMLLPQSQASLLADDVLSPSLEEIKENLDSTSSDSRSLKTPPRMLSSPSFQRNLAIQTTPAPSIVPLRI